MPFLKMGLITENSEEFVVVLVAPGFSNKTDFEQAASVDLLSGIARMAKLSGTLVPVWDGGGGRMAFRAPEAMHGYFSSMRLSAMREKLDRLLVWDQLRDSRMRPNRETRISVLRGAGTSGETACDASEMGYDRFGITGAAHMAADNDACSACQPTGHQVRK